MSRAGGSERLAAGVNEILARRASVGLAAGLVRDGVLDFHAHGLADIETGRRVGLDTVFRIASITKTFTAIAVMQLHEQGLVDLDAPASDYLRAYRLIPARAGFRPATLRHLLTHTAGISEQVPRAGMLRRDFGETVPAGARLPSLAEYYRGGLRLEAEPGTRFRYGDHGIATLGQLVEDVTGRPFHTYLREHVFTPLGMGDTTLLRAEVDASRVVTGYRLGAHGPRPDPERDLVPAGAGAIYSTPRDMARYLSALLGGGSNDHGSVLRPQTLAAMFAPQHQPDHRLPGLGLAFFRARLGGHAVVEHQGVLPPHYAQIVVAPDDGAAVMIFTNGAVGAAAWLPVEANRLLAAALDVPDDTARRDVPQRPEVWDELCGWYALPGPATLTDVRIRGFFGAGFEVLARHGTLVLRLMSPVPVLYRGFPLHPDDENDPYLFRVYLTAYDLGSIQVAFAPDDAGSVTLHLAAPMPLSAEHRSPASNPRLWAQRAAAAATAATLAASVLARRAVPGRTHHTG